MNKCWDLSDDLSIEVYSSRDNLKVDINYYCDKCGSAYSETIKYDDLKRFIAEIEKNLDSNSKRERG